MDRAAIAQRVWELAEPVVVTAGLELVDVQYRPEGGRAILRLLIDRPTGGVTIDELARVSRELGHLLDAHDAVPGRYTDLWFEATKPGRYHLFCAEFCGSQHARMIGQVVAMEPADFQAWLSGTERGAAPISMAEAGKRLFTDLGCVTCHQTDDAGRGPSLVGVAGIQSVVERAHRYFDEFRATVLDLVEQGDTVAVRVRHEAVYRGEWRTRIGTFDVAGKPTAWEAMALFRLRDGKIVEERVFRDELGMLLNVGALERVG